MNYICFLAQFPPPIHGLSKAVETLYLSSLRNKYCFTKIITTENKRILRIIYQILSSKAHVFYFTISQSKWGNMRDMFLLSLILMRRKKCVVHLHGGYYGRLMQERCNSMQRWINKCLMPKVERGIVLGESLKCVFDGFLEGGKIRIVPNCIDNEYLPMSIDNKQEELCIRDCLHVVYLSNFIKEKGYRELLDIARLIKDKGREKKFCFDFAGKFFDRSEQDYFEHYVETNDLRNVVFHGVVSGENKRKLLRNGNFFVLLTRYANEGQPISILEAMGNGMVVITTNHAGIPDIATDENGYVCDKNHIDINDVAEYLEHCYNDRAHMKVVCARNYKRVKENFIEQQYIENMDRVFEEVCYE